MPIYSPAPGTSSAVLKARVAAFMRRADAVLAHPLADTDSTFTVNFTVDDQHKITGVANMDLNLVAEADLIYLSTLMRSIIFCDHEISVNKLTGLIEAEHAGLRGNFKSYRKQFAEWARTPIIESWTMREVQQGTEAQHLHKFFGDRGPEGLLPAGVVLDELTSDFRYALIYFYGQLWHSDDDKTQHFFDADERDRQFILKCAEVRTLHAIKFVRALHTWVGEARAKGMDI